MSYIIVFSSRAWRNLAEALPEAVAAACWEFIRSALADNPRRVGKPLRDELAGRWSARRGEFRIVYTIEDERVVVTVVDVQHRRDVYRPR